MRDLATVLREKRIQGGLTQRDLAEQSKLDYTYISKLERGAAKAPSIAALHRLAFTLGCGPDTLLAAAGRIDREMTKPELEQRVRDLEETVAAFKAYYGPLPTPPSVASITEETP